jgi:hypothetical protein
MKKLYFLLITVLLSILSSGCSDSSGNKNSTPIVACNIEDTIENGTCENNIIVCNDGFSLDGVSGQCVENTIVDLCEGVNVPENGSCSNGVISCDSGYEFNNDTNQCVVSTVVDLCEGKNVPENGSCSNGVISCNDGFELDNGQCVQEAPTCALGEILDETTNTCIADENVKALSSGTVRDGLVSGATVTACKIVNSEKSEANVSCSKTDSKGEFSCAVYEEEYDALIFKAVGGTDLGENETDSRDNRANLDVLKSVLSKESIEANTSSFVSPATTLVVLKMAESNWTKDIATANREVSNALGATSVLVNDESGVKSARIVANILDALGDTNRTVAFTTLSTKSSIVVNDGVVSGLLKDLDPTITNEAEVVLNAIIVESARVPSDVTEEVIKNLADRSDNNKSVTTEIASNLSLVLNDNFETSDQVIDLVADVTDSGSTEDIVAIAKNLETVLSGATDKDLAVQFIKEKITNNESLTTEDLLTEIEEKITAEKLVCEEGFFKVDGVCELIPVIVKDDVNSPDDIPGIPNSGANSFVENSFPTIPSDNDYSSSTGQDVQPSNPAETDTVPSYEEISYGDDQSTPYSN